MADIYDYLDGLDIKFPEREKQLADIFAESWEYCRSHACKDCEYIPCGEHRKMLMCMSCQYAKRLIAADVAPVKHGHWVYKERTKLSSTGVARITEEGEAYVVKNRITVRVPYCSECGDHGDNVVDATPYSPNCGAKMDGG